ncbi:hypothetical protein ACX40Y_10265 [Sphingomonas sp. RS6]
METTTTEVSKLTGKATIVIPITPAKSMPAASGEFSVLINTNATKPKAKTKAGSTNAEAMATAALLAFGRKRCAEIVIAAVIAAITTKKPNKKGISPLFANPDIQPPS